MKILFVLHNYYPSVGGTQALFQQIAERLVAAWGDEVTVYTTDSYFGPQRKHYQKINEKFSLINGVRVYRFSYYRKHFRLLDRLFHLCALLGITPPDRLRALRIGPISPALTRAMQNDVYDVVCASASDYRFMQYPLFRNKGAYPKPFVFMGALHLAEKKANDRLIKKTIESIRASEYYIANTLFEKERVVEYGAKKSSVEVIGCGIDLPNFEPSTKSNAQQPWNVPGNIVIGFFGRHDHSKGIDNLIDTFEILTDSFEHISLVIAGAASAYTSQIKSKINNLPTAAQQRCFVLENIPASEKWAIINSFDLFVSPSLHESFGISFLEAWACKKPVVGANTGAVRSVVSHGKDGFLAQPGSAKSLAYHCSLLINDKALRISMGTKGFEKVQLQYTLDIIATKYRQVFGKAWARFHHLKNLDAICEQPAER